MSQFITLTTQSELPAIDEAKEFPCDGKTICLANANGSYSAMENVCPHRGGPLGQGMVEGSKIVCPWHGWAWDTQTGAAVQNSQMKVSVYPLKIENGNVLVEIE
ncbi:MAG: Rieske (2Fe-2S) protein [Candidatus Sulfotelmatobacter sp.]|jgi:nitrite reductase (NADH) small subunit